MADNSSTAGLVASPSPISGSESVAESKGIFSPADSTFKPSPYYHPAKALSQPPKAAAPAAAKPIAPLHEVQHPTDPGMLIHPPFDDLPDNVVLTAEGMNYSVMHQHPTWFLDIKDYITLDSNPEGALRYPRDLEPPRPRRQKDLLLRCTFCPRTYAGVNAKSMWTRHVREKHRVILSKAWSDTTTSARRAPSAAAKAATQPADTASLQPGSISAAGTSPLTTTVPLQIKPAAAAPPPLKGKPGPKPKPGSPAKAKKVGRKIIIPAAKPKPITPPPRRSRTKSVSPPPPPPIGTLALPPRMRPERKSFRASLGPLELQTLFSGEPAQSSNGSTVQEKPVTPIPAAVLGEMQDADRDSIASTPPVPPISIQTDPVVVLSTTEVTTPVQNVEIQQVEMAVVSAEEEAQVEPELPSMDVEENVFVDEPYEDVDMELEDEDEGLHPPISLGGLAVPVFDFGSDAAGQRDVDGRFELASRPLVVMSPVFSPGPSSAGASREGSVLAATPEAEQQQDEDEQEEEAETPPLGRFRVSSLAYLMDRNLTVSPPRSPVLLSSPASFEPQLRESEANLESTMFAAMQDVFVVKMRGMESELKARFVKHLEEQFGVRMDPGSEGEVVAEGAREVSWASLPENVVRQIMSEHRSDMDASSPSSSIVDDANTAMAVDCGALTEEFKQGSTAQLQHELDDQLHVFVDKLAEELAVPLQEALTAQLKNEIIVQVADQMLDALAVQGEEGEVEFEWRRRVLEQERWSGEDDGGDEEEEKEVIQHPLHHLFLGKAGTHGADFDMRILC